jgi:hypothetical protein
MIFDSSDDLMWDGGNKAAHEAPLVNHIDSVLEVTLMKMRGLCWERYTTLLTAKDLISKQQFSDTCMTFVQCHLCVLLDFQKIMTADHMEVTWG